MAWTYDYNTRKIEEISVLSGVVRHANYLVCPHGSAKKDVKTALIM